jgi:hypothetical protein
MLLWKNSKYYSSECLYSCLSSLVRKAHAPYYIAVCELYVSTILFHIIS